MRENLEELIFKLGINPKYAKEMFDKGLFSKYLRELKISYSKIFHPDSGNSNINQEYIKEINSSITNLEKAEKPDLEAAINSACEKDPCTIASKLKTYEEERGEYEELLKKTVEIAEKYKKEVKILKNELCAKKYKSMSTTERSSRPGANLLKWVVGLTSATLLFIYGYNSIVDENKPYQKIRPSTNVSYQSKSSKTPTTPSKPAYRKIPGYPSLYKSTRTRRESAGKQTVKHKPQNWHAFSGKLDFNYEGSLPLEDRILFDIFVKGNSSNFTSSSLDEKLLQCVKAGMNSGRNFNSKDAFDVNENGGIVYCDFVAHNVRDSKPKILSQDDNDPLGSGIITEKRELIRSGNYNLALIVNDKKVTIPIPFSMKREYKWYDYSSVDTGVLKKHFKYVNLGGEKRAKSFFSKYYQGDVAIDNEYAYIIHNDLNGPTLVKVSIKPYLNGEEHQGLKVLRHTWREKSLDKDFINANFKPGERRLNMDSDRYNIYVSFKIMPDFEDESHYSDKMNALLYIAIYNKQNIELIKKFGGLLKDTSPGVSYITNLKADDKGRFYIANGSKVMVCDSHGNLIKYLGNSGILPGKFIEPRLIGFDNSGNVYIADSKNKRIQKFGVNLQ